MIIISFRHDCKLLHIIVLLYYCIIVSDIYNGEIDNILFVKYLHI